MNKQGYITTTYTVHCMHCLAELAVESVGGVLQVAVENFKRSGWAYGSRGWCCPQHHDKEVKKTVKPKNFI